MNARVSSPWHRRAAVAVLVAGLYMEAVEWIDLYPWNDIRHGNGQATLDYAIAAVVLAQFLWLLRGDRAGALVAVALMGLWSWLQIATWWLPYFAGVSPGWAKVYAKWFAGTTQILPTWPNHLPPDANHLTLDLLIFSAFLSSLAALIASFAARRR